MKYLRMPVALLWLSFLTVGANLSHSQVWINEVLFNPPGTDAPNAYIELRGTPNLVLPAGTYFLAVQGDLSANPGSINNIFDLSGQAIGGNGFLVLLQKANFYTPNNNSTILVNTGSDPGFGSGSGSSINHRGSNGQTDLEHAPVTFFLVQTTNAPTLNTDIDANDDGIIDSDILASWTILDSIAVLGNNGMGYGAINFRKSTGALASGTAVTLGFTPSYIGRSGNTTGATALDWVASNNLQGTPPNWTLDSGTNTVPNALASAALNHLGAPNFGAPAIPGVVLRQTDGGTIVIENGGTDSYTLALNTVPAGDIAILVTSIGAPLEISTDNGASYGNSRVLTRVNTTPQTILVRAVDDNIVDTSPHPAFIYHALSSTGDWAQYPPTMLLPSLQVDILENDSLLLNELKVNPPGTNNAPYQYFEIKGSPNAYLTNVYLVAINGNISKNPGRVDWVVSLSGTSVGSSGLLVITATNCAYSFPPGVTIVQDPQLNDQASAFRPGTISFLLLTSPVPVQSGKDWDNGDNGVLEGLPGGSTILDAVGWSDGDNGDLVYGGVVLSKNAAPDAVSRFPTNQTSNSTAAWFFGNLVGPNGDSLAYDSSTVSSNFPYGSMLTPGAPNATDVSVTPVAPLSGVIDDPTNPDVLFYVSADGVEPDALVVTASSSNPQVVSNSNLTITAGPNGQRRLRLIPNGVGYATITITIQNGSQLGLIAFPYAASAMGRPGGRFHTGTSDSSTAFPLDADWMFVGDDQNQVIRKYNRNLSGPPYDGFDFKPYLDVTQQENGEVDIEASTHVGNRIFWMGSHSHNNLAESRTNRTRVFATDISGSGSNATLSFVGMYKFLKVDLINWDSNNLHGKGSNYYGLEASAGYMVNPKADDGSGFNIEGLTMAPGSTTVGWLGFRAPLVPVTNRAKALILPVLNFSSLAVSGAGAGSAVFGTPIELNLGCRGIRSMEADSNGVLIVAGPPGNGSQPLARDFKLYSWNGNTANLPQELSADLTGLNPEGLVQVPSRPWLSTTKVQLVSDNGNTIYYGDGVEAKHLSVTNFKKFRSDWVPLGNPQFPQPCIKFIERQGSMLTLCWCSRPGLSYHVQYKFSLSDAQWTDLPGNDIVATDATTLTSFSYSPIPSRFFRVIITTLP